MLHGLFVTGTDTGVGKTVAAAALLHRYRRAGVRYWKPIQTGSIENTDSAFVSSWLDHARVLRESYVFPEPLSPHFAALLAGETIDLAKIYERFHQLPESRPLIVEGAG